MTPKINVDIDIDGLRYLLVRLPKSNRIQFALSPREHEIARMVARGHHNKTIAGVLNISSWTGCTHLQRIFAKLGVNSRAAMVARLVEVDIVREKPPHSAGMPRSEDPIHSLRASDFARNMDAPGAEPRSERTLDQVRVGTKPGR